MGVYINYISFRFNQFFRAINNNVQLGNTLVVCGIIIFFVKLPNQDLYPLLFLLPIFMFHFQRKDILFLKKIFAYWQLIILLEYLFILVLVAVLCKNYVYHYNIIYALLGVFTLPFLKKKETNNIISLSFLPNNFYEIKSTIRKNIVVFIFQLFLFYLSSYHPFTLFLVLIISLEFLSNIYNDFENKELIQSYFSEKSIEYKVKSNLIFLNLLFSPLYIAYVYFNFNSIEYLGYYVIFMNLFVAERILLKYKNYNTTEKSFSLFIANIMSLAMQSALILPSLINIKNSLKKAQSNISKYVAH
ncbi:hypothetical protein EIB75_09895 [Epilithonimonas vandammei]|uniref:Uncharacterized protein n=1 Tax=Epilithonimonas vandammei TaxID=2487072 RepID=A0A3G8ZNZ4_9FLAO|nr:hypothetical protein [Epilithonimonas vandammei]AZI55541.1 hypothetical protein EIB75_09895 [Epilithonimonas vandammei]